MKHLAPIFVLALSTLAAPAGARTYQVGPTRTYTAPSQVANLVGDGDIVEIDAGLYTGDVATWNASHLTLRAVGGLAHLDANGQSAGDKAIWVITGDDTTIEDIEFSGATVSDKNGAGIRQEGAGLTVRRCSFHDNEDGILAGDNANSDILIERSTFARNGFGDGQSHNMYINHVRSFTLRYSWTHDAHVGHDVKSRAYENHIEYNSITDEEGGDTSYELQFPNGGLVVVIGNVIQQGASSPNGNIVSIADEGATNPTQAYYFVNNTFVNDRGGGTFIRNAGTAPVVALNNIFAGPGTVLDGPGSSEHDLVGVDPLFIDRPHFIYRLDDLSPAIDQGVDPGTMGGVVLTPIGEYLQPAGGDVRPVRGPLDLGAFEARSPGFDGGPAGDATLPAEDAATPSPDATTSTDDAATPRDAAATPDAGSAGDAGTPADAGTSTAAEEGCSCRTGDGAGTRALTAGVVAAIALRLRRRRR